MLNKGGELILKNDKFADIFNDHFRSIVGNLNIKQWNASSTTRLKSNILNDVTILLKIILTNKKNTKVLINLYFAQYLRMRLKM